MSFKIDPSAGAPLVEQIRGAAYSKVDAILATLAEISSDPDKAVHQARKDLKKVRALVRLIRHSVGKNCYKRENKALRDAGRALAEFRDARVRLDLVNQLLDEQADGSVREALARVAGHLAEDHEKLMTSPRLQRAADDTTERVTALRKRCDSWPLRSDDDFGLFRGGLRRVYRRAYDGFGRSLAKPSVANLHDWRKRCKYLRYHLSLLEPAWPPVLATHEGQLHELTNRLGDDHDLAVLRETLEGDLREWFAQRDLLELNQAITARHRTKIDASWPLARKLFAERPKAFTSRIETYWDSPDEKPG